MVNLDGIIFGLSDAWCHWSGISEAR